ncbi:cilia- and flagella-associated protein 90-like [Tubulanus polymorphus]|uniref:cilia- and flagella-associated protein 90-like n=1 Tax=Tubulanus polymorphus TaxID=672921 RepID=UPI003DA1CFF2
MSKFLEVETETDTFVLKGRSCELSAFSFVPADRNDPKERTVFNTDKKGRYNRSTYDRLFTPNEGYNNKLHRDDREHAKSKGLLVNDEEKVKTVPTLSSSEYGHRLEDKLDPPDRKHVRIAHVRAEFYRRNGIPAS